MRTKPQPSRSRPTNRQDAHCPELLNIINVAAEYLRDPERDPAESRALAALALEGGPMSTPEERHEQFARENEEWDERIKQELETSEGHWAVGVAFWLCIAFIAWLIAGHPGVA